MPSYRLLIFHVRLDNIPLHPTGKKCLNNIGSFVCICDDGYQRKGTKGIVEQNCSTGQTFVVGVGCLPDCDTGYKNDSKGSCVDADECRSNPCPQGVQCFNTDGSYTCMSCKPGFRGPFPADCTDIDECAEGTDAWGPQSTCFDLLGSYGCQCNVGFQPGNNGICLAINGKSVCTHVLSTPTDDGFSLFGTLDAFFDFLQNAIWVRRGLCERMRRRIYFTQWFLPVSSHGICAIVNYVSLTNSSSDGISLI